MKTNDFELPPLPKDADFPMILEDMSESDAAVHRPEEIPEGSDTDISDMENNPVKKPPKEDFKSARRRERIGKYDPHGHKKRRDMIEEFYVENEELNKICAAGRKNAFSFMLFIPPFAVIYLAADLNVIAVTIFLILLGFAFLVFRGDAMARYLLSFILTACSAVSVMNFFMLFAPLARIFDRSLPDTYVPDIFQRVMYLIAAIAALGAAAFLLLNKPLITYTQNSHDL